MTEEFALIQFLRDTGAIHPDQRFIFALAAPVQFPRNQLFSRTSLAQDQDGGISRRHHLDLFDDLPPRSALTNDFAECPRRFPVYVEV
jgi:hypothetical protein